MENEEHVCPDEDGARELLVKCEFGPNTSEGSAEGVSIQTHVHNVTPDMAATALLVVAHKIVSDHLAHTTFEACPSHELAHTMASAAAEAYLIDAIRNARKQNLEEVIIPDDVSSLLEGD
jgi:hypothetical protein